MTPADVPHRVIFQRVPYRYDPDAQPPATVERLGADAEGRVLFVAPGRAASRKHVYLPAGAAGLAAYVRDDPPADYGLADVLAAAFAQPIPRPEALALLGLLLAHHVVLADGTRLGGPRERLTAAVASVALEPDGFVRQASRVPDWALAEALRPRAESLRARLLAAPWVRALGQPELGFVRAVAPHELTIARTTDEPLDVGALLVVRSAGGRHPPVRACVRGADARTVRAEALDPDTLQAVDHGDPVELAPDEESGVRSQESEE